MWPLFCCCNLEMTLKLDTDLSIPKMYLHAENEVATLRHSKLLTDDMCMANEKNTEIALKVKVHGQMSPTFNHF